MPGRLTPQTQAMNRRSRSHLRLLFGALFALVSGASVGEPSTQGINAEGQIQLLAVDQARADADLLIGVMRDIHPGYIRYRSEGSAGASEQEFREAAAGAGNAGAFYLAVSDYLAKIRCEHTEAELPTALAAWRDASPTMLPVDFVWVDGTAIIVGVAPGVSGVAVGEELLKVDGHSMQTLFDEVAPHISVDGFTDHTKNTLFSGSDDIGLTTFDVFYPLLHGFRDSFELSVRSAQAEERTVRVRAVDETASVGTRDASGAQQNFSDGDAVSWRRIGNAAVLGISTFVNYRTPVEPDAVFGRVFREIKDSGVERLVLDLRNVGGGSTDVMSSLLSHLIDKPIAVGGPSRVKTYDFTAYREHLSTWDESAFDMPASLFTPDGAGMYIVSPEVGGGTQRLEPAVEAWLGPLTVLIGPNNESGATILLAELLDEREMTLIGQPTGGSAEGPTAGVLAFLLLPASKITVRVPLLWTTTSYDGFVPGKGIQPDIAVPLTIEDVGAGRDRALELATGIE